MALVVIAAAVVSAPAGPLRLLEFSENETRWVPLAEIDNLTMSTQNFFDVTDSIRRNRQPAMKKPSRIPEKPIHQYLVNGYLEKFSPDGVAKTITHLSSYFTRYYTTSTGREAVEWLMDQYKAASEERPDVTIELFEHEWEQPSLVVTILGHGPNKAETVILGGHADSTTGGASDEAPGADDDASGCAVVLEVFRTLMLNRYLPDRTVEFHVYAAEEVGLRGSQAIAEQYDAIGRDVVSMVEMDMVGYPANLNTPLGLTTDYVDAELTTFIGKCITTYSRLTHEPSTCGYACSDHASFTKVNMPSSFPFETRFGSHNPAIHTKNDKLSELSRDRMNEFARFALGYVVELSLNQ